MNMSRADQANDLARDAGLPYVQWRVAETVKNYKTGERVQYKTANPWQTEGYALNARSNVKEAAIRYVDYFFSDDFQAFGSWYSTTPLTNLGYRDRASMTEWDWNRYIGYSGFFNSPQFVPYSVPKTNPPLAASEEHYQKNMKYVRAIPTLARSGNLERWVSVTTDMQTYANTAMDEFITGRRPFSQWDAYLAELRRIGLNEGVAAVQSWYDAYWRSLGN
jgi:putative aldouronate transport system substrate-binding protein